MSGDGVTRRLAAILAADVVGYSRMMGDDEAGTLATLHKVWSELFNPRVAGHRGRIVKMMGDGALVEFASAVEAVHCAVAIQTAMAERNAAAGTRAVQFRIGVNLGDIVIEGDDIFGDGVNVAARLESQAPRGGVLLSDAIYAQVKGRIDPAFADAGEIVLKNISQPVRVWRWGDGAAALTQSGARAAEKPSLAVLPFVNMSNDAEQEYFSDGISEDIITDLSKVSALTVVSRNSAFQYKGKPIDLPRVARELNVSHVLEGSVRKAGGRVRITAQLVDGARNDHVWAERYDRDLNDIFALQDEISEAIVNALKLTLLPEEKQAIERRGTKSVEAYNLYLMARQYFVEGNRGDQRRTEAIIRFCSRAIEIDPDYAGAWALIARAQMYDRFYHGGKSDGGLAAAERALALDANLAGAHAVKARVLFHNGHVDVANAEIALALRLDPEAAEVNYEAAQLSYLQQRLEDAARHFEKTTALSETDVAAPAMLISCYTALGNSESARRAGKITVARAERVIAQDRSNGAALSYGVGGLAVVGETSRAREWIARALLVDPDNVNMRYNFACTLASDLKDVDGALDMFEAFLQKAARGYFNQAKVDPDLDSLRGHPRFKAMMETADARLAAEEKQ